MGRNRGTVERVSRRSVSEVVLHDDRFPPFRWMAAIIAGGCVAVAWAFGTHDAAFTQVETFVTILFASTGLLLMMGAINLHRRWFLGGVACGIFTFCQRAWELAIEGKNVAVQVRVTGMALYLMLGVYTLGLGLAYVRWEAARATDRRD